MIVVTINPKTQTTAMVSIPRDTFSEIVGNDTYDKINHAYWFGGAEMAINTVQKLLGIPIDYYASINMEGLKQMVDAVGGITVNSPLAFTSKRLYFRGRFESDEWRSCLGIFPHARRRPDARHW